MDKIVDKLVKKGFTPVSQKRDTTTLKSDKGVIIVDKNNMEGFLKGKVQDFDLNENKLSRLVSLVLLIGTSFTYFTTDVTIVSGISMYPAYKNLELIIRSKASENVESLISRNSVIKFRSPSGDTCIKRVIGMPGDEIVLEASRVFINGELAAKDNSKNGVDWQLNHRKPGYKNPTFKLKSNQYYVLGDNYTVSIDSRDYGPIDGINILSVIDK